MTALISQQSKVDVNNVERLLSEPSSKQDSKPILEAEHSQASATKLSCQDVGRNALCFMDLPLEVRNMIYKLALSERHGQAISNVIKGYRQSVHRQRVSLEEDVMVHQHWQASSPVVLGHLLHPRWSRGSKNTQLSVSILGVNRAIHNEAADVLYSQPFTFENCRALHAFLAIIQPHNHTRLLYITIRGFAKSGAVGKYHNYVAMTALVGAVNLRSLYIASWFNATKKTQHIARALYYDMNRFLEAYGRANGSKDAAVAIIHIHPHVVQSSTNNGESDVRQIEAEMTAVRNTLRQLLLEER